MIHKPMIDPSANICPQSILVGDVTIGADTSIFYYSVLRGDDAPITVGSGTNIQENCTVHASTGIPTVIGNGVTIGHNAVVHACEIGMGSVILDGAKIGCHCLVAAGSLVTKNTIIPDRMMVMGSPAKVKRPLTQEEIASLHESSKEYINTGRRLFCRNK